MTRTARLASALLAVTALCLGAAAAQAAGKLVRVGYQKYGTLILLKAKGGLEDRLKPLGYGVTWTEFPAGPQLLEAMNAGAIDFGSTGEAPPIFAQAAGVPVTYIANEPPAPLGEAVLVPKDSAIRTVADLKGHTVALNKGSNVHYLLVRALEKAGVAYADIKPVFLAPADARAAFERGSVDAWAIWDPYYAAGQAATGARTLVTGEGLVPNVQFTSPPAPSRRRMPRPSRRWSRPSKTSTAGPLRTPMASPRNSATPSTFRRRSSRPRCSGRAMASGGSPMPSSRTSRRSQTRSRRCTFCRRR